MSQLARRRSRENVSLFDDIFGSTPFERAGLGDWFSGFMSVTQPLEVTHEERYDEVRWTVPEGTKLEDIEASLEGRELVVKITRQAPVEPTEKQKVEVSEGGA